MVFKVAIKVVTMIGLDLALFVDIGSAPHRKREHAGRGIFDYRNSSFAVLHDHDFFEDLY